MRQVNTMLLSLLFLGSLPLAALAMSQDQGMDHSMHKQMEGGSHAQGMHGSMDHGGHGSMMEGMEMVGQCERNGVKAMAHIKAYAPDAVASMAKMGMHGTHHLMVFFEGQDGAVTDGTAAVKITGPTGRVSEPVKLMPMGQGFGADVALSEKGDYSIEVGTKLQDGEKRVFEFNYAVQ